MTQFEDYFTDKILSDRSDFWGGEIGTAGSQDATGVTISNANKTLKISKPASGAGAYLGRSFSTNVFPDRTAGDNVWFRLLVTEGETNLIGTTFSITVLSGGVDVTPSLATIVLRQFSDDPAYKEIIIPYTLQSNAENIEIRLTVKATAPPRGSDVTLTWAFFNVFNRTDGYTVAIDDVNAGLINASKMYSFFERRAVMSKAVANDSTDNRERIQDEINSAIAKKAELVFLQDGIIRVNNPLQINGSLAIRGKRNTFRISSATAGKELFTVTTSERIECSNFTIIPLNNGLTPTGFRFTSTNPNKDSSFESLSFLDFGAGCGLYLDNVQDFILRNCYFYGGSIGLAIGHVAAIKNVSVKDSRFEGSSDGMSVKSASGLIVSGNEFIKGSVGNGLGRDIFCDLASGIHENIRIVDNDFLCYNSYSVRVAVSGTGAVRNLAISGNYFRDLSSSIFSGPIRITGIATTGTSPVPFSIDGLLIHGNQIVNKQAAFQIDDVTNLNISANNVIAEGTFGAKAYALNRCPDPKVLSADNLISGQPVS